MSTITVNQLAKIVREMRAQQNEYFRFRTKVELAKSKKLEYNLDQLLKEIPAPDEEDLPNYSQQNLFV